jgi:hypothetical protein
VSHKAGAGPPLILVLTRGCGAAAAAVATWGSRLGTWDGVVDERGVEAGIRARLDLMERFRNPQKAENFSIKIREKNKAQVDSYYFLPTSLLLYTY